MESKDKSNSYGINFFKSAHMEPRIEPCQNTAEPEMDNSTGKVVKPKMASIRWSRNWQSAILETSIDTYTIERDIIAIQKVQSASLIYILLYICMCSFFAFWIVYDPRQRHRGVEELSLSEMHCEDGTPIIYRNYLSNIGVPKDCIRLEGACACAPARARNMKTTPVIVASLYRHLFDIIWA